MADAAAASSVIVDKTFNDALLHFAELQQRVDAEAAILGKNADGVKEDRDALDFARNENNKWKTRPVSFTLDSKTLVLSANDGECIYDLKNLLPTYADVMLDLAKIRSPGFADELILDALVTDLYEKKESQRRPKKVLKPLDTSFEFDVHKEYKPPPGELVNPAYMLALEYFAHASETLIRQRKLLHPDESGHELWEGQWKGIRFALNENEKWQKSFASFKLNVEDAILEEGAHVYELLKLHPNEGCSMIELASIHCPKFVNEEDQFTVEDLLDARFGWAKVQKRLADILDLIYTVVGDEDWDDEALREFEAVRKTQQMIADWKDSNHHPYVTYENRKWVVRDRDKTVHLHDMPFEQARTYLEAVRAYNSDCLGVHQFLNICSQLKAREKESDEAAAADVNPKWTEVEAYLKAHEKNLASLTKLGVPSESLQSQYDGIAYAREINNLFKTDVANFELNWDPTTHLLCEPHLPSEIDVSSLPSRYHFRYLMDIANMHSAKMVMSHEQIMALDAIEKFEKAFYETAE